MYFGILHPIFLDLLRRGRADGQKTCLRTYPYFILSSVSVSHEKGCDNELAFSDTLLTAHPEGMLELNIHGWEVCEWILSDDTTQKRGLMKIFLSQ